MILSESLIGKITRVRHTKSRSRIGSLNHLFSVISTKPPMKHNRHYSSSRINNNGISTLGKNSQIRSFILIR